MTRLCFVAALTLMATGQAEAAAEIPFCDPDPVAETPPAPPPPPAPAEPPADFKAFEERLRALEEANAQMKEANAQMKERLAELEGEAQATSVKAQQAMRVGLRFGGFVDAGFFWVDGNGAGTRSDTGHQYFPQLGYIPDQWVFMGDPLATQVNSRGDSADTGDSRAVLVNDIANGGKASFIINSINLNINAGLDPTLAVIASIDFLPRVRNASAPGVGFNDFIDVRYAYAEYIVPTNLFSLNLFAGKFDPVLGLEYRSQDAPDRLTVTPSLICRYTCGRQTGVKARAKFFGEVLNLALAVTNGSAVIEQFPFANSEVDYNNFKTISGRLGAVIPIGAGMDVGVSGAFGAQDLQARDNTFQWHFGVDFRMQIRGFQLTAEYVRGQALGRTEANLCDGAPCLFYQGAYGLVGYQATNWLTPYVRTDWREATHLSGLSFAYISRIIRVTGGLRFDIGEHALFKAEYTHSFEVGGLPQIANDVATSSLVVKF